ncbi:DNRLRE domain-containing protein [Streptomyces laurentii]|uniref:DNRLRE domain-containing protein n=1 Tax=Streptomyces laurentii TaxID=39478 RepID=UPI0036C5CDA8
MTAPPRYLSPFVRTRTRLSLTLGLLLAALTAALLPWWQPGGSTPPTASGGSADAIRASTGPRDEAAAVAEAARTGKKVLVETATTATTLTWALPDGLMRTRINALPVRAKNADGVWAPVDNTLKKTAKAPRGLGIAPANPVVPVRFASGSPRPPKRADRSFTREGTPGETVLASVVLKGHDIAYTWPGPLPEPVLSGPRALYSEVLPGVDLLIVAREEGGFAQLLIVKTPEAAKNPALATVSYGLRSTTATFRHDKATGRVEVLDPKGVEIGSVPTPFAWDSSGRDPEAQEPSPSESPSVAAPEDVLGLPGLSGIEPGALQAPLPLTVENENAKAGAVHLRMNVAGTGLFTDENVNFPVFVDPTLNSGWQAWTVAYKPYPSTSFYNGTNFSSGTSDARVGHEDETGGTARSFWRMGWNSSIKGATVSSATFKVLNNHSWSCEKREFQLWLTTSISSGTTWKAQPSWPTEIQKKSFAHGWSSSCGDEYESFNVKSAAQKAADGGWTNITLGMRATAETDTQTWRKFKATSAVLEADYNRKPSEPTNGASTPGGACVPGTGAGVTVGKTGITLSAKATDPDNNLQSLRFRLWKTGSTIPAGKVITASSGATAKATFTVTEVPLKDITTNTSLSWDVIARDQAGAESSAFPPGGDHCRITVDPSGPSQPIVTSDVFVPAAANGTEWAKVNFGGTGPITFESPGAAKFTYGWGGVNLATVTANAAGVATVPNLKPLNSGPNTLLVTAYDSVGNASVRTDYMTYVPPRNVADSPGDTGGDGIPDIIVIDAAGALRTYPGQKGGELYSQLASSYRVNADGTPSLHPAGHWYDPKTGKAALIAHYQDTYPGDGTTDLFAATPDGGFWLYPGDGYGSYDVDKRIRIRLPSNAPAPSTWTQLKAVGDITGDKHPDLALRAGTAFWVLSGYSGGTFQSAMLMEGTAWAPRDIINLADMNKDNIPDLLWRNVDSGAVFVRHGKLGPVAGSVDLVSLKVAANAADGDVPFGNNWTKTNIDQAIGIPDINDDGIPDIWARFVSDGHISIYHPSTTDTNAAAKTVISSGWGDRRAFG